MAKAGKSGPARNVLPNDLGTGDGIRPIAKLGHENPGMLRGKSDLGLDCHPVQYNQPG